MKELGFSLNQFEEFINELTSNKIHYLVIAGLALDGKRGHLSRFHEDLDLLCLLSDQDAVAIIYENLGYSIKDKKNNLYQISKKDSGSIHICYLVSEGNEFVAYGNFVTRFPKNLFYLSQRGKIDEIEFNIGPNELLKIWGIQSKNQEDREFAQSLKVESNIMDRVSRIPYSTRLR